MRFSQRVLFGVIVLCLLATTGVLLVAATGDAPSGKQSGTEASGKEMIDRAIAGLGGNKFLQMNSRLTVGRIYGFFHDRMSGRELVKSYVEYLPAASKAGLALQERQLLGKKQDYSNLFTPTQAWDVTYRGARPYPDEDWERYVRTTRNDILYILRCRLQEPGMQFDYVGSDMYISRHVEIVEITDATNQVVRVYFDHNTMLPMHETYEWFDDKFRQRDDVALDYDKYRNSDGVMWPYVTERARNGYKAFQLFADSVEMNPALPKDIFELPKGADILKAVQ